MRKIELMDGKYTIVNELEEGGGLRALRYGEEWRNLAGDNLALAMAQEIEELREENERMRELLNKAFEYGTSSEAYRDGKDIEEIYEYLYGGDDE